MCQCKKLKLLSALQYLRGLGTLNGKQHVLVDHKIPGLPIYFSIPGVCLLVKLDFIQRRRTNFMQTLPTLI